ncbi:MAG: hypothetical protein LC657_18395 [Desulfobacteraceae bacterium]|nr:hypothetical protein [Desulfobacteraceae bacterium]
MNFGRKITQGTPQQVSMHPEVLKAYLGGEDEPDLPDPPRKEHQQA